MEETRFSALLNWTITNICNFHCDYCIAEPYHTEKSFRPIDIDAVVRNLNQQGETFCLNITGGEPLIVPNIVEILQAVTKDHYISLNTNLVSKRAEEVSRTIDPKKIIFINASLHIFELEKHNLINKYISNFLRFKNLGINIFASIVGHPAYLPVLKKYEELIKRNEITLIGQQFIGEYNGKKYPESYTPEEIEAFHFKEEDFNNGEIFFRKNKPCSAGYNFGTIKEDGDIIACYRLHSRNGNIFTGFKFNDFILKCPSNHCSCPTVEFYPHLLRNACKRAPGITDNFEILFHTSSGEPVFGFLEKKETSEISGQK